MKRYGDGNTPFVAENGDIPDNDPQELKGITDQFANGLYAENKGFIEASGQTLTNTTTEDLTQVAKAALIFSGKASYFTADGSTANNKILKSYNTGFVFPTLDYLDGFEFQFINKQTNTGAVTMFVDGVGQTTALPLLDAHGNQFTAGAITDGFYCSARYVGPLSAFVLLTSQYAPINSPALTGTPTAPTAPQFDNSKKVATTEWVKAAGVQYGDLIGINQSTTLTAAHAGKVIYVNAPSAVIVTLPPANSLPAGGAITIFCTGVGVVSLDRPTSGAGSSDLINLGPLTGTGVGVARGEDITLVSDGKNPGIWYPSSRTAALAQAAGFDSSIAGPSGYQKLPGGYLRQWGGGVTVINGVATVTYPIAFASLRSVSVTAAANSAASCVAVGAGSGSLTQLQIYARNPAATSGATTTVSWSAEGTWI